MSKTQIIESFVTQGKILERDTKAKNDAILCRAQYQICSIGEKNRNNRIYEEAVWEKVLNDKEVTEKLKNKSLFFHAEHPTTTQSNTEKVAGVVTDISIKENKVFATMEVLDTPYGRIVDTLLKAGCGIGVSTRADGELEEATDETGEKYSKVIPESYRFVTIDFTADPSTYGSEVPLSVERDVTGIVRTGLDNEKLDLEYATVLLEHMKAPEAIALLETIKSDKHHKDCQHKLSEKKCNGNCPNANKVDEAKNVGAILKQKHISSVDWTKVKNRPEAENYKWNKEEGMYKKTKKVKVGTEPKKEVEGDTNESSLEKQMGLPVQINVDYDEKDKWYWEDSEKDTYRQGFGSRKIAIEDALKYLQKNEDVQLQIKVEPKVEEDVSNSTAKGWKLEVEDRILTWNDGDANIVGLVKTKYPKVSPTEIKDYIKKLRNMEEGKVKMKEDVQLQMKVDPKVKQFLTDNWKSFVNDDDAVKSLIDTFKIGEKDAKEYVEEVAKGKGTISAAYAMNNEKIESSGIDNDLKDMSERLATATAERNQIVENYTQDSIIFTNQINSLKKQLDEAITLKYEMNKKAVIEQTGLNDKVGTLEKSIKTLKETQKKAVNELKTVNEAKIVELNAKHKKELLSLYTESRLKALGLNLHSSIRNILDACESVAEVELEIKKTQNSIREGIIQSSSIAEIKVNRVNVNPAQMDISRKIGNALKNFGV